MNIRLTFLSLCLLIDSGVFGDEVKSVMEGDSVTLHTDFIKQKDDLIMWYYGSESTFVARINGKVNSAMLSDDEILRDRLRLDYESGDLTISDIRTSDSGLYTLKISNNGKVSYKRFSVTVSGVFDDADDVKSVSVRKGHSLILYTPVLEKSHDVIIEWRFGPENTLVAKVRLNETAVTPSNDERFRDGVNLDDQTGELMIHDTKTHHSGLYTCRININNKVSYKEFDVTVHDSPVDSPVDSVVDSRVQWLWLIPAVLLIGIFITICIWVCGRKQRGYKNTPYALTDDRSSMDSKSTFNA